MVSNNITEMSSGDAGQWLLKFDTFSTQVLDFIGNRFQFADYKSGLMRFSRIGSGKSNAANSDF